MGYHIRLRKSEFCIKKRNKEGALNALKKLGVKNGQNYYSWMNGCDPSQWDSLKEAMNDWRYKVSLNKNGDIDKIEFIGEKMGQDDLLFQTIAPFVDTWSYLHFVGEDGEQWILKFDGVNMVKKKGKMVFE